MILPRPRKWAKQELEELVAARVFTVAQVARAVREVGEDLGLIGGDCFARHVPQVQDILRENLVIHVALRLPPPMLRHQRTLCQRMVRAYLATASEVEAGDE